VAQTGEEAKNPEKTVPRAMFLCIAISAILFIATAVVAIGVSGWQPLAAAGGDGSQAISYTANISVPYVGAVLIAFGIIVGSIAAVNSIVFSASRVSFAMGRDGNLPATFGKLHPKKQTPVAALLLSGAIIIGMVVLLPLTQVASVADILILLLFTLVNISAITLRRNRPDVKRHFITPWFPIIPLIGIVRMVHGFRGHQCWIALALLREGQEGDRKGTYPDPRPQDRGRAGEIPRPHPN
jgi:amino acid transporter